MFVAGIDAHTTYSAIAIVNNAGDLVHGPERIPNAQVDSLENLLDRFRPWGCPWPGVTSSPETAVNRCTRRPGLSWDPSNN